MAPLCLQEESLAKKVQRFSVLYAKRAKGFTKRDKWFKMSWRKYKDVTRALSYSFRLQCHGDASSNPPIAGERSL